MMEFFADKKGLIGNDEWLRIINSFKPDSEVSESEDRIALQLRRLFEDSIKQRLEGKNQAGIMFSGGLDSSYIAALCKRFNANFTCYTVGFQDGNFKVPEDIEQAQLVVKHLGLENNFKFKVFDIKEMEQIFKDTIKILSQATEKYDKDLLNVVNVGVAAVEYAAYSISNKEKYFFSGLGSEELFAGYDRHRKNPTNDECYQGLLNMYERDLLRDSAMSSSLGFDFLTPFLDKDLVKYSLSIPIKYKLNNSGNKLILRKAAYPLLKEHSERPKRAAQYGSSFDRALS